MTGTNSLTLTTEVLKQEADSVEALLTETRNRFENVDGIVNAASSYWEGDGYDAFLAAWRRQQDKIEEIYSRLDENVNDLRQMAGLYESAEALNTEMADALPSDVIV